LLPRFETQKVPYLPFRCSAILRTVQCGSLPGTATTMANECLFCRIAMHEIDAHVVYEDELVLAFLDICPIRAGHTQIASKQHFPYFDDTPFDIVSSIVIVGQKLASAMKRVYRVPRVAFLFTGGDIPHVHAHVVPMHHETDITSGRYIVEKTVTFRSAPRVSDVDLARCASELRQAGLTLRDTR
jgi:histidine triad (HIT) family protein